MNRWIAFIAVALLSIGLFAEEIPGWTGMGITRSKGEERSPWLHVRHVTEGGPAATAGIRAQDVITHIDGKPVTFKTDSDVLDYFGSLKPAQKVKFTVRRADGETVITVTAARMPPKMWERWKYNRELIKK